MVAVFDRSASAENFAHRYRIESSPERKLPRYWKTAKSSRLKVKVPAWRMRYC